MFLSRLTKLKNVYNDITGREIMPGFRIGYVSMHVNSLCNAKCKTCDIGQRNGLGMDILRFSPENHLSLDTMYKVLNDPIFHNRKITFSLVMTEPLLSPKICEIAALIKDYGHTVDLTTNGFLLPEKAESLFNSGLDSIQVSLDGPPELNDEIRGLKDGFQKAINGLIILQEKAEASNKELPIRINCTVSNLNYQYLEDFANAINTKIRLNKLKFQYLNFVSKEMAELHNQLHSIKMTISSISEEVDPELVDINVLAGQLANLKNNNYDNIKEIVIKPDSIEYEDLKKYFNKKGERLAYYQKCEIYNNASTIKTNGDVLVHTRCLDYVLGNIHEGTLKHIYESEKRQNFINELKSANYCLPVCTRCCGAIQEGFSFSAAK